MKRSGGSPKCSRFAKTTGIVAAGFVSLVMLSTCNLNSVAGGGGRISGTVTLNGVGLPGVTLLLSPGSTSTTTNANGAYTVVASSPGTYTVTPSLGSYAFSPASQQATLSSASASYSGANFTTIQYSLRGLWSSPSQSGSLNLVTTSSLASRPASQALRVKALSKVSYQQATDRIVVRYRTGIARSQSLASRVLSQGKVVQRVTTSRLMFDAVKIDTSSGKTLSDALAYYRSLPEVADARPDGIVHALGTPNDTNWNWQWDLQQLNMPTVWSTVTGAPGVVVAVLDTGLYRSLPDFAGSSTNPTHVQPGYNALTSTVDTSTTHDPTASSDDNGHGTHVSGTIAEASNNGFDVAGMAYGVTLLPVKVLDQTGSGYWSDVAAGIEWAITQTPKPAVINMSLGGSIGDPSLLQAVEDAYNAGVAVIAAAGNESLPSMDYPAAYQPYVLSVGATGYNKELAYYSNYGSQLDVVAPGGDDSVVTNSASPNYYEDWITQETINGYNSTTGTTDYGYALWWYEGTSMATPHVSALAALLVCQNSSLTPAQVYDRIERTADSLGAASTYGYGLIDPAAAIVASGGTYDQSQTVTGAVQVATPSSYTFAAAANSAVKFEGSLSPMSGSLTLKLYDSNNNLLSSSSGSPTVLSFTFTAAGTYRIEVDYIP